MPYLLHTSILLTACFAFYWLLLRRETFFKLNRWVLISSILISISLPFISIPESWSLQKSEPIAKLTELAIPTVTKAIEQPLELEENNAISETTVISPEPTKVPEIQEISFLETLDFGQILKYLYFIGLGVFSLTFLVQLLLLIAKMTSLNSMKDGKYRIVELVKDEAPYSFFNAIFVNPAKYDPDTFEQIIDHEKIHIKQVHFFDKMIAEILLIVFWFNPIVWLYRRAITNNLEYLTDHSMLRQGTEKQRYQLSLLQVSVPQHPLNLTTNYNQSFLKDRITMMNSKKSSARSFWKYLFILPLFGLSMMSMNSVVSNENNETFTQNEIAQSADNEQIITDTIPNKSKQKSNLTKNSKKNSKTKVKEDESRFYVNNDGEELTYDPESGTTIRKEDLKNGLKRKTKSRLNKHTEVTTDGTGKVITETKYYSGGTNTRPGSWQGEISGNQVCFQINNSRPAQHSTWISTECFNKSELSSIPIGTRSSFTVTREAGVITFAGEFGKDNFGHGDFKFAGNATFANYLKSEGVDIKDENDRDLLHFFFADINKNYVRELRAKKFDVSGGLLRDLAIHEVSMDYIKSLGSLGFEIESTRELVEAKIHGITPEYAAELSKIGFDDLSLDEIKHAKIHGVSAEFVVELSKLGFDNLSLDEIKNAKIHGVSAEFAADMRAAGFPNLSLEDLKHGAIHGVSPDYVQALSSEGFKNLEYQDIINAKIHSVSANYIREVRSMGYKGAELRDIQNLKIHGVTEDYLRSIRDAGFPDVSLDDITGLKIHGVTPRYIQRLKQMGFKNLDIDDIAGAKIHGVTPDFIDSLRELGFDNIRLQDYVNARIHGVTPRYIERARKGGYNLQKLEDYVNIKIRGVRL